MLKNLLTGKTYTCVTPARVNCWQSELPVTYILLWFFSDVSETDNDYIYTYKDRNIDDDHDDIDDDYVMSMAVDMIMMAIVR